MKKYLQEFLKEKPFFFALLRPKEVDLYQRFKPFKKPVLDFGCGDGFFAEVAFGKIDTGLDLDKKALEEAESRKVYEKIHIYPGHKAPFPNNYFSTVVSNSVLEHIPNLNQSLSEISRVLKKGGKLYFTAPTSLWPQYLFGNLVFGKSYQKYFIKKSKHYNLYSLKKWKKILTKYNLEIKEFTFYLDNKKMMYLFDISHYLSIPSLISKKLFNRWVLFPQKEKYLGKLEDLILKETKENSSSGPYIFIYAQKK